MAELRERLRAACSARDADDVAVTSGDELRGSAACSAGMDLGPGDEIVTSDSEHPGLLGPLIAARQRGATVRAVPFTELANAVRADDDARGGLARELAHGRARARGAGRGAGAGDPRRRPGRGGGPRRRRRRSTAPPTPPRARSGCAAPTAPGCSTSSRSSASACARSRPSYHSFEDARRGLDSTLRAGGAPLRRAGAAARGGRALAGRARRAARPRTWTPSMARAADLAERFAAGAGRARAARSPPRGRTTLRLVGGPRPAADARERLAEAGVAVRDLPGHAVHARARSAPGTTSPTSSGCSPRCDPLGLRLLRLEPRRRPRLRRGHARAGRRLRRARHPDRLRRRARSG